MKKKYRDITVGGQKYAWTVGKPNVDGDGNIALKIWKNKKVIYDELTKNAVTGEPITPKQVSDVIIKIERFERNKNKKKFVEVDRVKALKDFEKMLRETHDVKQTKSSYKYYGEEITHFSVLAGDTNVADAVSREGMAYNRERDRTLLQTILSKLFQLGYNQAEIIRTNADELSGFIDIIDAQRETIDQLNAEIKKFKKK